MPSVNELSDIPQAGNSQIIVALVNGILHFEIFDRDGAMLIHTDANSLTQEARRIEYLRQHLENLWPPHELTKSDNDWVITFVTSIVGLTPWRYLLYIKATLTGDEPADLLQYHKSHPRFPQEPTMNQFFDEAQWESYRRLGEHIGLKLLANPPTAGQWTPREWIVNGRPML